MAVLDGVPDTVLGELYPFEDRYVQLDDGTNLHYVERGRALLGRPTMLLLHGNPTWSFLYRNVIPGLAGAGRVIAVDLAGFGRSDHPRDVGYHTLERHIANLEEFAARLALKRVVVVGHDWGGPIGLGYATRHPEDIAGLVLMETWAFTERERLRLPLWYRAMRKGPVGAAALRRRNLLVERFLPRLCQAPLDDAVMAAYRHPFPTPRSRAGPLGLTRMVPDRPSHPDWAVMDRIEKALPSLDVPARLLWARRGVLPLRFAEAFHAVLPRAEPPTVVEAGHYLQEDAPQAVVAEIRDFVRNV